MKAATATAIIAAAKTAALRTAFGTSEKAAQFAVEVAPEFIKIGWALVGTFALRLGWSGGWTIIGVGFRLFLGSRFVLIAAPARVVQIEHASHALPQAPWEGDEHLERGIQFHGVKLIFSNTDIVPNEIPASGDALECPGNFLRGRHARMRCQQFTQHTDSFAGLGADEHPFHATCSAAESVF